MGDSASLTQIEVEVFYEGGGQLPDRQVGNMTMPLHEIKQALSRQLVPGISRMGCQDSYFTLILFIELGKAGHQRIPPFLQTQKGVPYLFWKDMAVQGMQAIVMNRQLRFHVVQKTVQGDVLTAVTLARFRPVLGGIPLIGENVELTAELGVRAVYRHSRHDADTAVFLGFVLFEVEQHLKCTFHGISFWLTKLW